MNNLHGHNHHTPSHTIQRLNRNESQKEQLLSNGVQHGDSTNAGVVHQETATTVSTQSSHWSRTRKTKSNESGVPSNKTKNTVTASCTIRFRGCTSSSTSNRHMIQNMFLSCVLFVIVTIYYGSVQTISIIRSDMSFARDVMKYSDNNNYFAGMFGSNKVNRTTGKDTTQQEIPSSLKSMTDTTRTSISAYVLKEASRMINTNGERINPCTINSEQWLNSTRYGNLHDDPYLSHDLVQHMILNLPNALRVQDDDDGADNAEDSSTMPTVLGQTICHKQSRFLHRRVPPPDLLSMTTISSNNGNYSNSYDPKTVRLWAVKLIYLAIHYHQHRLAVPEAVLRYKGMSPTNTFATDQCSTSPQYLEDTYNVGKFDYECPDAKYLVMPLGGNGLGSNVSSIRFSPSCAKYHRRFRCVLPSNASYVP
jgi:hypothetical protein